MAEHVLETRIQLRYDTYTNWLNSTVILKTGEAAIAVFPSQRVIDSLSTTTPANTPPAVGIKIGDGYHRFSELPWLQAIAADVYNWAKTSNKPTYTASEISGLTTFLEENFNLSGDVTFTPRIYQITNGTGDDANKYYLRYKESNENSSWVIDTNHPIDLSKYEKIAEWIGTLVDEFFTLGTFTADQTRTLFRRDLVHSDTAVTNQFVTSVSETAGIISVERAQPNFTNISGIASAAQGGTGLDTLPSGQVLIGNGISPITSRPIAESIANNNHLVPNYLVKAYVDNAVAGLTGAMHFIGEATVVIRNNSSVNPNIKDYNFFEAKPGDVILYTQQEFVWDGSRWVLLGDEGSYAVKGSIADADIVADANIAQSKIANLTTDLNSKVDKIEGKTLTSNDFTNELYNKLLAIEDNAEQNIIEHIFLNGTEIIPSIVEEVPRSIDLQIAEFDTVSQTKLAGIEEAAQVNIIEKVIFDGIEIVPENKTVTINSNPHTEHINVIESIYVNNVQQMPNSNKEVRITVDIDYLKGARVPSGNTYEDVNIDSTTRKLELARIAKTGNIDNILQTNDTYIILDCGTSEINV